PQVLTALFGRVLRKRHVVVNGPKPISRPHFTPTIRIYFQWLKLKPSARLQLGFPLRLLLRAAAARLKDFVSRNGHCARDGLISAPIRKLKFWRRRRDSNPRYAFGAYNGLANRRLQPLGHVSVSEKAV